jgi:hypothetical protein
MSSGWTSSWQLGRSALHRIITQWVLSVQHRGKNKTSLFYLMQGTDPNFACRVRGGHGRDRVRLHTISHSRKRATTSLLLIMSPWEWGNSEGKGVQPPGRFLGIWSYTAIRIWAITTEEKRYEKLTPIRNAKIWPKST